MLFQLRRMRVVRSSPLLFLHGSRRRVLDRDGLRILLRTARMRRMICCRLLADRAWLNVSH